MTMMDRKSAVPEEFVIPSAPRPTAPGAAKTFIVLLLGELLSLRLEWFWYFIQVAFVPVVYMVFVSFIREGAELFAVTGSLVTTVSLSAMLSLGQHLGSLKETRAHEYYATLPVSRTAFVAAIATRGVLLSLPAVVVVATLGRLLLGIKLNVAVVPVLLLGAYAMSGLGAFIGFWSPTSRVASLLTQIVQNIIIFFAPVYLPSERLPIALKFTSKLVPTTYVANAVRSVVAGMPLRDIWSDMAILLACAVISLALVPLRLNWRQR